MPRLISVESLTLVADNGAAGDGSTDDTAAFAAALAKHAAMGITGTVQLDASLTYVVDGTQLPLASDLTLDGQGSTLLMKPGTYGVLLYFLGTRTDPAYSAAHGTVENVTIRQLTLDGNAANITTTSSVDGIRLHQMAGVTLEGVSVQGLPGETGDGYGINIWYSDNVSLTDCNVDGTDRQGVLVYESVVTISGGTLQNSFFREPLLVSGNTPATLRASACVVSGVTLYNTLTNGGDQNVVRVSAGASLTLTDCAISSDGTCRGMYEVGSEGGVVTVVGGTITGTTVPVEVVTDAARSIDLSGVAMSGNAAGPKCVAAGVTFDMTDCTVGGATGRPLDVQFQAAGTIHGCTFDGGTELFVRPGVSTTFDGNTVQNMTNASYAVLVSGSEGAALTITGNVLSANATNIIRLLVPATVSGNTATIVGP